MEPVIGHNQVVLTHRMSLLVVNVQLKEMSMVVETLDQFLSIVI